MNLFRFVKSIGLTPLLCGNVKGLQDRFRNPTTQAEFAAKWGQNPYMVTSFADGTKISFEQAIVANATGMSILQRGMTGRDHHGHVDELTGMFDVEGLRAAGGVVDYVVGAKPGPGVFVLAAHDDPKQQHYLNLYKLGTGPLYSFYTPYHLCHFEVPLSVARAVLVKDAVVQALAGPKVEVITTAKRPLSAGETIDELGGYMTYGQCERYDVAARQRLLPMGQAAGCRLKRSFAVDEPIGIDDVEFPRGRTIDRLRSEQDSIFAPADMVPVAVAPDAPALAEGQTSL
jgi:predicted homoserine dehydrogenase-like protein